jgi:hypothetical protein
VTGGSRDAGDLDALITDRYLDALLAGSPGEPGATLPRDDRRPDIHEAATRLRDELPRLHPSFRFEERLAQRLAGVAAGMRLPHAVGGEGTVVPIAAGRRGSGGPLGEDGDLLFAGPLDERPDRVRPLLIGGALTSAALSLAGAAYVAWRRTRPATTPMERAVRAVAARRLA